MRTRISAWVFFLLLQGTANFNFVETCILLGLVKILLVVIPWLNPLPSANRLTDEAPC
jgi:hypothetical protein